ncbi:zinc-ribbon domain-containing protein [Tranquillimonas rosea]|uniref:zinc-ribbon domain-containing protein n=1 Tax=Tranquillimonas rosea TaxID=641238 RepID=UPI003BA92389
MRLICPNCAAQYEVDAGLIPEAGRDVQCSSCGHTWFQPSTSAAEDTAPANDGVAAAPDVTSRTLREPGQPRPKMDEATRAILREEAEREAEQRRRERAGSLETQGEFGLEELPERHPETTPPPPSDPEPAAPEREDTLDTLSEPEPEEHSEEWTTAPDPAEPEEAVTEATEPEREDTADATPEPAPDPAPEPTSERRKDEPPESGASRRDLLPDIEEINSTLTATSTTHHAEPATDEDTPPHAPHGRRGFRLGFGLVIGITALAMLLYGYAPRIAAASPALEAPLEAYVAWANDMRDGLDSVLENLVARLGNLSDEAATVTIAG